MTTTAPAAADVAARLRVAIARLGRHLRQHTVGDLTLSLWSALATVEQHQPLRIGDLAEREGISAPTATRVVASLEDRGLVVRTTDTADRRSSYVALTRAGRERLDWARRARTATLARRLSTLDDDDLRRVVDVLPLLERLADEGG